MLSLYFLKEVSRFYCLKTRNFKIFYILNYDSNFVRKNLTVVITYANDLTVCNLKFMTKF